MTECFVLNVYASQKFKRPPAHALKPVFDPEAEEVGRYLRWAAHKFEVGFCVRCGQKEGSHEGTPAPGMGEVPKDVFK